MNQHFKRMTALCLLVALVFGLVGEVPFMALATAETDSSANTDVGENTVENLMAGLNPSFEDYTIPNWSKMEGVVQSDEQLCDDGKWALQLNDSSSTASTWSVSDKVTIEAGKNYTISAQVYGGIGQMTAYLYDADANELADQTISIAAAQAADSWQTLSQDFTAPSNATQIAVKLSTTDTGEAPVWFDAVSVVSADTTLTGGNVLTNGGFETRSIVSNTPWDKWEAGGLSVANKLAVDYIGGDYGYAARIYGSSNVQTWSAPVAVTPGETYSVSLDAKGEGCIQVYIRYYASAEATYSEYMSNAMLKTVTLNEKDSWTQVAVSGSVAPEGAACARVWVVAVAGGKEFSFNFDNVLFVNGLAELKVPGEIGALRNPSFEELNEDMPTAWTKWGGNETVHSIVTRDADTAEASTNVYAGDYALKISVPTEMSGSHGVISSAFPVESGVTYRLSGYVMEDYNEDALLGAKISYGTVLSDIVLFNRGTGTIDTSVLSTTHVSTNGQQASILGLNGGDISEGYAVTNGTSLRYGNLALMTSDSPVSVAVDFTMAKLPVKNGVDEPEVHEDFNENNPVIYVSSKAEAATEASIYLGINATYTVIINGQTVESQYIADTGMLTMTIPAGENQITIASVHDHEWVDANCTTPRTCSLCGETEGEALGHTWIEATCTTPRTCSTCGTTVGTVKAPSTTVINFAAVNGIDELLANGWSYYLDNSSTVFSIVEDAERGNVLQFSHDGSLTYVKDENGAVVKNEDGTDKVANPFGIISGFVPVNGGADVRITMDVKRLDANAPASYMLYVYFYGSDYNAVANEAGSSSVANRFYYHGTSWDAGMVNDVVQFDLTLPESAAYVKYMIYDTSSVTGTIQFDNIVIQEVETITTVDDVLRTDDLYEKTTIAYSNLNKVGSFENITTTGLRALGWNPRNRDNDTGWLSYTSVVYDQTRGSNVLKRESSNIQIFLHPLVDVSGMSEFWYEMNVSISDGAHLSIYPAFFDADGNALSKGSTITVSSSVTRDGTWQNYIGTAKEVPEGAAYIMAFIQTGYGTVMIDNFNCVAVAAEETDVDVTFEEGWNWDNLLKRGWSTSSSEIGVPTIEKVNGNCVLKAVNTNLTGSRFIYSPYIALGDTETMYFSAEGMKSSGYVYAYVRFYDANKNAIKYTNAAGKTVNLQFSVNAYSNGQWVTLDTVCNFAEVAETYADSITGTPAYARIMLQMEKPGTDGATTEYYWDNISLRADHTTHNVSENFDPMISTGDK